MPATEAQRALGKQGGRNVLYLDYFSDNPGIYIYLSKLEMGAFHYV